MCTKKYITFFQRYPLPAPPLTLTFKRKITSAAEVSTLFQNCLFLSFLFCKMKSRKYIETERAFDLLIFIGAKLAGASGAGAPVVFLVL